MNEKHQCQGVGLSSGKVLECLQAGATLITATTALAADWKQRIASRETADVITVPDIVEWRHWLLDMAASHPGMPAPLTAHQEILLWEQLIRHDLSHNYSMREKAASVQGLVRHASKAWMLMREYCIDVRELSHGGEEAEALARWIHAMKSQLAGDRFSGRTLAAEIPRHLYARLRSRDDDTALPASIILDGFELLTPMQCKILEAMRQTGCDIFQVSGSRRNTACTLAACQDESGEILHIAKRIRILLDHDERMHILVLTADSGYDVTRLRRVLDHVLIPDACLDPQRDIQAVATSGDTLNHWPMIEQALHLLSLAGQQYVGFDDFSPLLFFPWLSGYADERMGRALLDVTFRKQNRRRLSMNALLKSEGIRSLPSLLSVVRAMAGWKHGRRSAAEWVKAVQALLLSAGFVQTGQATGPTRSNLEIRQVNAFRDALNSLVALDAIEPEIDWNSFLSRLRASCAETRFGLAPMYPNIMVMPLNQVAGMQSGHVFIMGMNEEAFPPQVRPQPLLPVHAQRKYGMPMSSGARVFESACWLWDQVLRIAPTVECSYARHKDEREMLPSSFVAGLPEKPVEEITRSPRRLELEDMEDTADVPLRADEHIRGGASIIKNQSACPFRAFATHRLGITILGETTPGIEPTKQGSLIHLALEFIWEKLGSQAALLGLTERARVGLLNAAIEHAWEESHIFRDSGVQAIEKKRMWRVLDAWLNVEAARPPFEVVAREKTYNLTLPEDADHACSIDLTVDRMDRDGQGRRILIDYKTGKIPSISQWMGERMAEPQLPLYALAAEIGVDDAVAFAAVRSGDAMGFAGLAGEDTGIAGMKACDGKHGRPDDWRQTLDDWHDHINALAEEFAAGRSVVAPRDKHACDYCGLEAVCRVEETGFEADVGDDA